ncbi:hypothetical protein [Streptomyces sp. NPDC057616]|uniref:hypothetical protein n=1 Tax=Streptomyces sp. NPDC057616 TaxID=3346183 RepID=UPI00369EACCB
MSDLGWGRTGGGKDSGGSKDSAGSKGSGGFVFAYDGLCRGRAGVRKAPGGGSRAWR